MNVVVFPAKAESRKKERTFLFSACSRLSWDLKFDWNRVRPLTGSKGAKGLTGAFILGGGGRGWRGWRGDRVWGVTCKK